jgi:hypothetical protein
MNARTAVAPDGGEVPEASRSVLEEEELVGQPSDFRSTVLEVPPAHGLKVTPRRGRSRPHRYCGGWRCAGMPTGAEETAADIVRA